MEQLGLPELAAQSRSGDKEHQVCAEPGVAPWQGQCHSVGQGWPGVAPWQAQCHSVALRDGQGWPLGRLSVTLWVRDGQGWPLGRLSFTLWVRDGQGITSAKLGAHTGLWKLQQQLCRARTVPANPAQSDPQQICLLRYLSVTPQLRQKKNAQFFPAK